MNFDYMKRVVVDSSIDIETIGNCALTAFNDNGEEFVLIIRTVVGITEIIEYGPIVPDMSELPKSVSYIYSREAYSEFKIAKTIRSFLNNPKYGITQVLLVEPQEAKKAIRSMVDFMNYQI